MLQHITWIPHGSPLAAMTNLSSNYPLFDLYCIRCQLFTIAVPSKPRLPMVTSFLRALIGLWRKLLLLQPQPLRYLLFLWRALRTRLSRNPPDEGTRGDHPGKLTLDRQSRVTGSGDATACASRLPLFTSSSFADTTSAPVEFLSRPASTVNDDSVVRADLRVEAALETQDGPIVGRPSSLHSRFNDKTIYPTLEIDRYGKKICLCARCNPHRTFLTVHCSQTAEAGRL